MSHAISGPFSVFCVFFCFAPNFQLRTVCYNLLGLACKQGALYLAIPGNKVQEVIVHGILAGLEYTENR